MNNEQNKEQNTKQIAVDNLIGSMVDNGGKTVTDKHPVISDTLTTKDNVRKYNVQNLKPVQTKDEARTRGRNGGIKSGEVRRQRKTMKETILAMLSQEITPEQMEQYGLDKTMLNGDNTMQGAIIASMLREALNGSEKAALLLRDTINEAPVTRSEVVQEVITKEDVQMIENVRKELLSS